MVHMDEQFLELLDIAISSETPAIVLALENLLALCKLEKASGATIRELPLTAMLFTIKNLEHDIKNLYTDKKRLQRELSDMNNNYSNNTWM